MGHHVFRFQPKEALFSPLAQVPGLTKKVNMTPELLQGMGRKMGVKKAAGMDYWGGGHLRLWPLALWEWVSELFDEVELRGRWLEALRRARGQHRGPLGL